MVNFTLMPTLLCTLSCISVSVSELRSVEVQPGEGVTLMCTNLTRFFSHIRWFRLTKGTNVSCISAMLTSESNASFCEGFKNGRFRVTSNITNLFLQIKPVDLSDSGLYFCGEYRDGIPGLSSATYLKVGEVCDASTSLTSVILGGVTLLLVVVIISLAAKIRTFDTAQDEGQNPQSGEDLSSDALNYASLSFGPEARSSRRPAPEPELDPHVVYAAAR